jgi:hypothetical protein
VAGISASEHLATQASLGNVVATDMGGTSFDIGLVPADGVKHYDFMPVIDRWLVSVPMIHLVTLGAGGGSIASYNRLHQSVSVGPRSAGSDPGPACYDRGGLLPTVTDADLLLGYLTPERYAGGQIKLNPQRSEFAIDEEFGDYLDLEPVEVARLIKAEVDEQMANGMAKELRIRGYLPAEFTMLAYGGNAPQHCCGIARHLGIDRVLAPPYSSVFSALGAGNMPQLHIHERSVPLVFFDASTKAIFTDFTRFNGIVAELEDKGRADLRRQGCRKRRSGTGSSWTCATATSWSRWPSSRRNHGWTGSVTSWGSCSCSRTTTGGGSARAVSPPRPASGPPPSGSRRTCRATPWSSTRPRRTGAPPPLPRSAPGSATSREWPGPWTPRSSTRAPSSLAEACPDQPSSPRRPLPTLSNPAGGSRPARTAPSGSWRTRQKRRTGDE